MAALIASIASFSFCQRAFISAERSRSSASSRLDRLQPRLGGLVGLLLQCLALDLELLDAALDLVDLGRHRVDLDLQSRGGLIDQVDRLVGQEAVGYVALRESRRGDDRRVGDPHPMVHLIALLQPTQDRDRVAYVGLADVDRLKAPLQRRVLLDVLAVLIERRRADRPQLAPGQHRLQQVGGIDGAFGGAGSDDRVQLVEEEDDLALGLLDLGEHRLQPFLELPSVFRAGEQRADVEGDHAALAQALGHVSGDDSLRQPLHDRRLADAGVADQDRVILGAAREDLDHAADLLVAPDHRVELVLLGLGGEIAAEFLQRLHAVLGVRRGDAARSCASATAFSSESRSGRTSASPELSRLRAIEDVPDRDVLVAAFRHLGLGLLERLDQRRGRPRLRRVLAAQPRQRIEGLARSRCDRRHVRAELLQDRHDQAAWLLEQRHQQVGRGHLGVSPRRRESAGVGDGFLGLDRESVRLHQILRLLHSCRSRLFGPAPYLLELSPHPRDPLLHRQHRLNPCQVEPFLRGHPLDPAQPLDIALGVKARVLRRALRGDQAPCLIHPQGLRVHIEPARRRPRS